MSTSHIFLKIILKKEKFYFLKYSNRIKDSINEIENQIDIIIKNESSKSLNIQLKIINKTLFMIKENINENNDIIFKSLNDKNNNITMIKNALNNKNLTKIFSDNKLNLLNKNNEKNILSNKVKSDYIIKKIFSYLNEKNKLKIIKYNKNLQNKININLINYKLFKGIYIEYESETKVKEYYGDTGNIRFEGEYLNGKRNGKGKEYHNNENLMFEGEYFNGERNGKGKEYYEDGNLKFEGEYLNGKRNGKGKEYDGILYILIFDGEYKNGLRWTGKILNARHDFSELKNGTGYIKYINSDGYLQYEAQYSNGKRNGKGKKYDHNGKLIFEGEYKNDKKWNGKGYDASKNIVYELIKGNGKVIKYNNFGRLFFEGEYLNGEKNGKGIKYGIEYKFEGEYLNGKRNGKGKEYYNNGQLKFEGGYLDDKRNGKGKEFDYNGQLKFEGIYLYNFKLSGKEYIKGKLEYEGDYLYGNKFNGKGYDEDGNKIYELNNGNGKVKEYDDDGKLKFEGKYLNGKKSRGKEYNDKGIIYYYGEYLNGQKWNGIGKTLDYSYDCYDENHSLYLNEYEYINGNKLNFYFKIN